MVCGGSPMNTQSSEAARMKAALEQDFATPVTWLEDSSRTTFENALNARARLAPLGIGRIALVTHALHMPRARLVFERAGFEVISAPTGYSATATNGLLDYLPSAHGLQLSRDVLHEFIGSGWYHVRLAMRAKDEP
jgi:uncharacterized SAM-binding protein YcdF (DUF218 family)